MGTLAVMSDLHADINQLGTPELTTLFSLLKENNVTRLHFAGDTANKIEKTLAVCQFFRDRGIQTTFTLGNHEMGDISGEEMIEHYPDSHFLNLRYLPLNDQTVLLGFNGWYDYSFSQVAELKKNQSIKNAYWYDRIIERFADDPTVAAHLLISLKKILESLEKKGLRVIFATHFVPRQEFIVTMEGRYQIWNKLNAFLGMQALGELLDTFDNIDHVVFGHTHRRFEPRMFAQTQYNCRPFGYFYEWQITRTFVLENQLAETFIPMKMRSLLKKNEEAFLRYKKEHLIEEYRQALTLISY